MSILSKAINRNTNNSGNVTSLLTGGLVGPHARDVATGGLAGKNGMAVATGGLSDTTGIGNKIKAGVKKTQPKTQPNNASSNPYQELYNGMPTPRKFTDENGNITGLPEQPKMTDENGNLKDAYTYKPTSRNPADYKTLNRATPQNTKEDGTLKDQFAVDPTLVDKRDIERIGYQDFSAQRGLEERGVDRQLDANHQNTLRSLQSQGGLSAADRLAAGKGQGRDRANAYADLAGKFGQMQSDNIYKTDATNAQYGNAFIDKNADIENQSKYYNSNASLGESWKDFDANMQQDQYNANTQNAVLDKNSTDTNDAAKYNTGNNIDQGWNSYNAGVSARAAGINQSNNEFNNDLNAWAKRGEMKNAGDLADMQRNSIPKPRSWMERIGDPAGLLKK